jgi:hypothetical protein
MKGKEEDQIKHLQKKGLGVAKGPLDPLLALQTFSALVPLGAFK